MLYYNRRICCVVFHVWSIIFKVTSRYINKVNLEAKTFAEFRSNFMVVNGVDKDTIFRLNQDLKTKLLMRQLPVHRYPKFALDVDNYSFSQCSIATFKFQLALTLLTSRTLSELDIPWLAILRRQAMLLHHSQSAEPL